MKFLEGIPKTLYKYRSWDDKFHRRLLTHKEIFLASPANLNDPFDASIPFKYDEQEMSEGNIFLKLVEILQAEFPQATPLEIHQMAFDRQKSGAFEDGNYWKEQHSIIKNKIHSTLGIFSTTEKDNNLRMWAHYADSHKGFCIGLDSKILFSVVNGLISPVNYTDKFPVRPLFNNGNINYIISMLTTKSVEWEDEKEFRLTKGGASNKTFILPSEAITEIVLGCNMSLKNMNEIIAVLKINFPKIKISMATPSLTQFKLDINPALKHTF